MAKSTAAPGAQDKQIVRTIDEFIGLLAGKTTKVASLEEIKDAAEQGWAGQK